MTIPVIIILIIYLAVISYLGYRGFKQTKNAADYMVGGRKIHPYVMALSYGATFISTSAIVGFGGLASALGMSLLWLSVLNIGVGIFVAFVVYGKRTRRMGLNLDAHTFPEFLGRRLDSKFIQWFSGIVIFILMPLYAAAVLIGAARLMENLLNINYDIAVLLFAILVAVYVIMGGLKGVMYTDALQGTLMFIGMAILIVTVYATLGGVTSAHLQLTDLGTKLGKAWTSSPAAGSPLWWVIYSSIVLGVGVGVLAQPQLVVRYMTVKSNQEMNRAVLIGGIFILMTVATSFVIGSLSNVWFHKNYNKPAVAMTVYTPDEIPAVEKGKMPITLPAPKNKDAKPNVDKVIPLFVNKAMPKWFGIVFLLVIVSAAMSTLSSQFHTIGTSIGRDFYENGIRRGNKDKGGGVLVTRIGIVISIIIAVVLALVMRGGGGVIARATAIFFGVMAASFLAPYTCSIFWKRLTKKGAIAGILTGIILSVIFFLLIHAKEASIFGIVSAITGGAKKSLFAGSLMDVIDPLVFTLPASTIVTIVVSLLTKVENPETVEKSFAGIK